MKVRNLGLVAMAVCLLGAVSARAGGPERSRFTCLGLTPAGESIQLDQYERGERLGSLVIKKKTKELLSIKVMGLNSFPVGSQIGDSLYGVPPHTTLRLELTQIVDDAGVFHVAFHDTRKGRSAVLKCQMR